MSTRAVRALSRDTETVASMAEEGLIFTDMSLEAIAFDDGAAWILQGADGEIRPWNKEAELSIPQEVRNALSSLDPTDLPITKMRFRIGSCGYNCRAFLVRPRNGGASQPMLALHLQKDSSVTDAVRMLATKFNLTDREEQALRAIALGHTSKEAAQRMNISPNTVKSFMRLIMIKMGVASRAGIVGKLLEFSADHNNRSGTHQ